MFNKFLNWLDSKGRMRIVLDRESKDPYLIRYYLFLKDRTSFPFNLFLHKFLKSDPDDLHDHPWPFISIVLKGGYWEWLPIYEWENGYHDYYGKYKPYDVPYKTNNIIGERKIWRGPGSIRFRSAKTYHRIELDPNVKDCWTLFIPGKRKRDWGFLTHKNWHNFKWVPNEQYIKNRTMDAM